MIVMEMQKITVEFVVVMIALILEYAIVQELQMVIHKLIVLVNVEEMLFLMTVMYVMEIIQHVLIATEWLMVFQY